MILLDVAVALLLIASIVFSWRLNKSIGKLKESKVEIAESIIEFSDALNKAEESIAKLKILNAEVGNELRENIDRAKFLANDLSFLIQKGNEVADKMEGQINLEKKTSSVIKLATTRGGKAGEFDKRANSIAEGQISSVYNNILSTEETSLNTKGVARKFAMEQALELLARKNLAKVKIKETEQETINNEDNISGKARQRRLFDALKWGRQLNN